ncbi:hypothetical protein BJ508DRAFT_305097 [Ascobolus immersus RN42]|uniref:Rpr2-domain-containing protein n=1 Tax=Ascobolus immersus RN42 TaxID=1160509 RepID=A0A3N4IND1_ASCIM|nr:hypothetical protein BJ508DRAFT_305097 [Ascobolus immersus RN42]
MTTQTSTTHPHLPHLHHLSAATALLTPISPLLAASTTDRLLTLIESRSNASSNPIDGAPKREVTLTPANLRTFCKKCNAPLVPGWSCTVRTANAQERYTVGKDVRKRMRKEARKRLLKDQSKAAEEGKKDSKKEGEAVLLRRKQTEKEKGIVIECEACGYKERIVLEKPKAVRKKKGVKKIVATVKEITSTTTKTTTVATPTAVSKVQTTTQTVQTTTTLAQQGTAKARAKKRKQGLLSEVLAKKKQEDEAKARGGLGGGLGGLNLMDLMKTG